MRKSLLETYSKRIALAESVYSGNHNGAKLSDQRKLVTAVCLNNVNRWQDSGFK